MDNMLALVDERTRLVFFANTPSNPTGTILPDAEDAPPTCTRKAFRPDVILVIDGAYSEFCDAPEFSDGLDLARTAENVIVTRTFSKLHGLAALRVGWAYGPLPVVEALDRIRLPFNVVLPGHAAAVAALADEDFQQRSLALVRQWIPWLTQQFGGLGLEVTPSHANFLLVTFPRAAGGKTAAEAEAFLPRLARPDRARRGQLRPARLPAHHRGAGRAQPRGGRRHRRLPEGLTVADTPSPSTLRPIYDTIAVIGCGLIGGSVARAARQAGMVNTIVIAEQGPAKAAIGELHLGDRVHFRPLRRGEGRRPRGVRHPGASRSARPPRSPPSATSPAPPSPTWARSRARSARPTRLGPGRRVRGPRPSDRRHRALRP